MNGQLLLNMDYEISSLCETSNYLHQNRWGYYTLCCKPLNSSGFTQRSLPLHTLQKMLRFVEDDDSSDYWITQAVFSKMNRRKVSLAHVGVAFVDLDFYKIRELCDYQPEHIVDLLLQRCELFDIPLPSLIVDSGTGLHIKWYHDMLPQKALTRWEYLQTWLNKIFLSLGADTGSKDISRILRIVRTVNQKNKKRTSVLWVKDEHAYTQEPYCFNYLIDAIHSAYANHFRPIHPAPKRTIKRNNINQSPVMPFKINSQQYTTDSLNWARVCDLKKLVAMRGDMGDGLREPMAFYLCNHYALRYSRDLSLRATDEWHEFRILCQTAAPGWSYAKIREKTRNLYKLTRSDAAGETVSFSGKQYRPLYTPKNEYLIDLFGITDNEQIELSTIIGEAEHKRRRTVKAECADFKEFNRDRVEKYRRNAGCISRKQFVAQADKKREVVVDMFVKGYAVPDIVRITGYSQSAVYRYISISSGDKSPQSG